ncbi:uncharacterized protein A4U43_C07F33410 [Asparagus officinalis]|uniref:MSP domain-containing protein n=1 Tax=Asparagus officinalis TaxID=4686 RepID=A0A5P1EKF9_ASPOF|nr:ankyrin repeat domain-containing protein 65-like [Asparagus officinalis]ONK65081.1 uncharacterized protein A4U43_C07F33410 [Asparagus officinalis]
MDRLISLEPSNEVAIRIEPGERCYGQVTLRNVMYTMPVAFRLQAMNKVQYTIRPQSGIIAPLATLTVVITYVLPLNSSLPESIPKSTDSFLLDSVVVPGAAFKDPSSTFDSVPNDWFTTRKKQVFTDSGMRIFFVGSAVLTRLVAEGSMDQVREVLELSNPEWNAVDSIDYMGQSLLHIAISHCRADLVQLLLEFNPNVESRNRASRTPLEAAAAAGESLIVELLLAHGASTEKTSASSWSALHFATASGHLEAMRLLTLKGADVNSPTSDGRTALHLAVEEHRRDCARLLLAGGARADIRGGPDGDTPLHIAASTGDEQMVKLLITKGSAGLKEVRNFAGKTSYDAAAEGGHGRLFDMLKLGDGLALAARKGEVKAAGRMIERGAAVNGRDQNGWTALMRAGFKGRAEVMKALLEKGAEVDARDEEGYTALHCAVEAGHVDAVEVLVKRGADLEAKTAKGATAMKIAYSLGYAGIARILAQNGAAKDNNIAPISPEKQQIMIGGKNGSRGIREKEVKKKGSRLSFGSGGGGGKGLRSGFDRQAMAVASH